MKFVTSIARHIVPPKYRISKRQGFSTQFSRTTFKHQSQTPLLSDASLLPGQQAMPEYTPSTMSLLPSAKFPPSVTHQAAALETSGEHSSEPQGMQSAQADFH